MYEIEGGVPVAARRTVKRTPKYPFNKMGVDDSFLICADYDRYKANSVRCAAKHWAVMNAPSSRFVVRQVGGGARCWRVK